jgi:hypothetical protein
MDTKQQTAVKLYTEEQLLNTVEAIRNYLKNYPEKFHESMIKKHLMNLAPIELPSDEEIQKESLKSDFEYTFRNGAKWMRDKIQGGEQ